MYNPDLLPVTATLSTQAIHACLCLPYPTLAKLLLLQFVLSPKQVGKGEKLIIMKYSAAVSAPVL